MSNLLDLLKPKSIKDIVGQKHLLHSDGVISKMITNKYIVSSIFYGNPGIGKSSIAKTIAIELNIPHSTFNAAIGSKEELKNIVELSKLSSDYLIIIDEIHRLNKDKQDILLPLIENDKIKFFLTTTENPFFSINPALRSRCQIFELKPISQEDVLDFLKTKIKNKTLDIKITDKNLLSIINHSNGDLRSVINTLDLIINLYLKDTNEVTEDILKNVLLNYKFSGTVDGDEIHNLKSALQKSIRGSDENAALYYLARLLNIGDYEIIFRRLLVILYEDIGLANPNLMTRGVLTIEAAKKVGMPEARYMLSYLVIEMALSEKSNSAGIAYDRVISELENGSLTSEIPYHLRDGHYKSARKLGVTGYLYPHSFPFNYIKQQYLPNDIKDKIFYIENEYNSVESKLKEKQLSFKNKSIK